MEAVLLKELKLLIGEIVFFVMDQDSRITDHEDTTLI